MLTNIATLLFTTLLVMLIINNLIGIFIKRKINKEIESVKGYSNSSQMIEAGALITLRLQSMRDEIEDDDFLEQFQEMVNKMSKTEKDVFIIALATHASINIDLLEQYNITTHQENMLRMANTFFDKE